MPDNLAIRIIREISAVSQPDWDSLLGDGSPFMKWDWLDSLEKSCCVNEATGWLPHHLIVERHNRLIAACPMYPKLHSMGEFAFDHKWPEAAQSASLHYSPKMLAAAPCTSV